MTLGYPEIARVLADARRRHARILAGAAALRGAARGGACLLLGAVAIAWGARPSVARTATLLGIAAAVLVETVRAIRVLRGGRDPANIVRMLAPAGEPLRSSLLSAVELSRDREALVRTRGVSAALVEGHLESSARAAAGVDLVRAIPARPAGRAASGFGAVAALLLLSLAVRPVAVGLKRLLAGDPSAARIALEPITGDVELTLRYPAYMRREPRTVSGTGGEVRAPLGTEVALRTRADRPVKGAEIDVAVVGERGGTSRRIPLSVSSDRDLFGRLLVGGPGSYRFRFLNARGRAVAEGPPIPIVLEPDAFPEVRITAPQAELEVQPGAVVKVEWQAQDDVGLGDLTLVTKPAGGAEKRVLLKRLDDARRDGGAFDLDLGPLDLAEGERLLYWLEVTDDDAVSGPKKGASATQVVKVYSEAEHRRKLMEEVRAAWEELVGVLGDHLELVARGGLHTAPTLPLAEAMDGRAKRAHEHLREVAAHVRKDKAGPKELARGLENAAATLRIAEQRLSSARQTLARVVRAGKPAERGLASMVRGFDDLLDAELERAVLYLETLLDRQQAQDLVQLARDLARSRRDLADQLDRYRRAPNEAARKEVLARIARMKERMNELMARMAEAGKGLSDEHMNEDALRELAKSKDVSGGLDDVEKALARGDVEGAMKALDAMGSAMQQMLAGLERTAGMPSETNRELMKDVQAFKQELDALRGEQKRLGAETEQLREAWRQRVAERMRAAEQSAARLERLAKEASAAVAAAERRAPRRAQGDLDEAKERLESARRALDARDLPAALDAARQALGPANRTAMVLEEEAQIAERYQQAGRGDAGEVREAQRQAQAALRKTDEIRRELERLLPDPTKFLSKEELQRLAAQGQRQQALDGKAAGLQEKLGRLQEKAPIFPPTAAGAIGEVRGHMGQASGELRGGNVQRGRSEQAAAEEGLDRFAKGLEQMAQGGGAGGGFPLPFGGESMSGQEAGDGGEPTREKVEIPGAEAWRAPTEFRKGLLDAMKQGTPEKYEGEVKRYYEELVK